MTASSESLPQTARGLQQRAAAAHAGGVAALLAALLLAGGVACLAGWRPALAGMGKGSLPESGLLRPAHLARFDGQHGRRILLAVMGEVYDVTAGKRHYGPKGGYSIFAGRDASRSYVTGKFRTDLTDDVADFTEEQLAELARWRDFYAKHKEYTYVGKVVGRFFDTAGEPTALRLQAEAAAAAAAQREREKEAARSGGGAADVPCNVKWSKVEGGWVWCDGGLLPRRVLRSDWEGGQAAERCACVEQQEPSPSARLYDGCGPEASTCQTSPPELALQGGRDGGSDDGGGNVGSDGSTTEQGQQEA
ncbi:Neuferricin isoform A [Micractinium conductrix]|uniref:Neuferricin isoform A n=1 Tax=Micractinium conductrix TaxID=554055 RepID=A0A2P6VCA7_9CHLO|nr:Neuferricin isoform A [Micractinium conductrix]|eukprot:PSC71730.1 Neuferricin isoform A [Micractinium conductrix]